LVAASGWMPQVNYTFTTLAEGRTYFYRVRSRDQAGNVSGFSPVLSSRQDASAPTSRVLALSSFKTSAAIQLDWSATDSLSGVAGVQLYYAKDGGPASLYPGGPFSTTPISFDATTTGGDGAYGFYTIALDNVANSE